jgi:hypothetical protein
MQKSALFRRNASGARDLRIAREFVLDEPREFVRRARIGITALCNERSFGCGRVTPSLTPR